MKRRFFRRSLRLRLMAYAAGIMIVTLLIAGVGLTALFTRNVERRIGQELDTHIAQLAGSLRFSPDGVPELAREPADPRFEKIFGGLYWQIRDAATQVTLRSRSLWDSELDLADDTLPLGDVHVHEATGPAGTPLIVHEQALLVDTGTSEHRLRIAVAVDRSELDELSAGFARDIAPALLVAGIVLLAGFAVQISSGLKPMDELRVGVADIRTGRVRRLNESVPREAAPLVTELNTLLDQQEAAMVRARDRAADLAHGLKTSLAVLAADGRRLRARGVDDVADDIDAVAERMRLHVERAIARARLRHGTATPAIVLAPAVESVVRALRRAPEAERLRIDMDVPEGITVRIDKGDLSEIIGNIAENAMRHAVQLVRVRAAQFGESVGITVEDDGPGVDAARREEIATRGKRLDEEGGAGLGLAIVGDILDECGGRMELGVSGLGGLSVTVTLPSREA